MGIILSKCSCLHDTTTAKGRKLQRELAKIGRAEKFRQKTGGQASIIKNKYQGEPSCKRGIFMEINAKTADRNLLLELSGEIDHHGARNAIRELELAVDTALPKKLVLDMTGVTFMDSSGIALILRAQQRMQLLDGSLLVCNVPQQAKRVLDAAGIGRLVTIR